MGGYPLTLVEWLDIAAEVGWESIEQKMLPHPCVSVGYLIEETDTALTLAATISDFGVVETNNRIVIPKGTIKSRRVLNG